MKDEPKYTLADFSPEEAKEITSELDVVLSKHSAQFVVTPVINPNGTIGAKVEIFQKVELVPKSVESPYADPKEESDAQAEEGGESDSGEPAPVNA